jgi:hypothetical protein
MMSIRNSFAGTVAAAVAVVCLSIAVQPAKAGTMLVTQTFDSATSAANAGWTGFRNTVNTGSYGWNSGNQVSGTGGQAGGIFARTSTGSASYYADLTIGQSGTTSGTLDRATETLTMSGLLRLSNTNYDGTFRLGYFNTGSFGANGNPFIGINIGEPAPSNASNPFRVLANVDTGTTTAGSGTFILLNQNQTYSFSLTWTPTTGGAGTLTGTIGGNSVTVNAPAGTGSYNAFGIINGFVGTNDPTQKTAGSYFDNLTYAVVPEPSMQAIAGVVAGGALSWTAYRRRRRNRQRGSSLDSRSV